MIIKLAHSGSIPNLQSLLLSINIELGLALLLELHLKLNFDVAVKNSFIGAAEESSPSDHEGDILAAFGPLL
jgi:hypothetical protein